MKITKRIICMLMCLLMLFSSLSTVGLAAKEITYSGKYYTEKSDSYNAERTLNMVDEALEANKDSLYFEVKQATLFGGEKVILTLNLTSINNICKTIDDYKGVIKIAGLLMGDLKDLDFSTWQTGMTRERTGDMTIIKEVIELINANRSLVQKICNSEADLGLVEPFFDINTLLGPDGVSGFVKGLLVGLVYDKNTNASQYNAAYEKAKYDVDSFIYTDLLYKFVTGADGLLPGFTMNQNSTVEDIIIVAFGLVIDKYIAPALKNFDVNIADFGEELKDLAELLNLKGSTYDFSKVRFVSGTSLLSQVNNVIGEIVKQILPKYTGWQKGDYTLIESNVEAVFRYLAKGSGFIENVDSLSYDELMFKVASLIMGRIGFDSGVQNCKTLEDLVSVLLVNIAKEIDMGVTYKGTEHYTVVLGDILAWVLGDYINLTNDYGITYKAGGGKDIWEVMNYLLNYIFFDKNLAGFTGIAVSKSDTMFVKLDKFIDCFGENKNVNFDSKKFLMGDDTQKGVIDSLFTLDLQNLIDITAVKALNCAGDVSVVEFIYKTVKNILDNWAGATVFPAYTSTRPLNNALQNDNLSHMVEKAIEVINQRKDYAVPLATFILALLSPEGTDIRGEITVTAKENVSPLITVNFGGTSLIKGKDYTITETTENSVKILSFRFMENYSGDAVLPVLGKGTTPKTTIDNNKINLRWNATPYATEYEVYADENNNDFVKLATVSDTEYTFEKAEIGKTYNFRIKPVARDDYAVSYGLSSDKATVKVSLQKVKNLKATKKTEKSVDLSWSAVSGAAKYDIYILKEGKWTKAKTVEGTSYTVSSLKLHTEYSFKVRAVSSGVNGDFSDVVKVRTKLGKPANIKSKNVKSTSARVYWSKVSGADYYLLYQYSGGEWKRIAKTKDTAYDVKSLSANKTYYFRVRAYNSKTGETGDYTSKITVVTIPATVKNLKSSAVKTTTLNLSWSKVSGATSYEIYRSTDGKSYKKIKSVNSKTTSFKDSGLKKDKKYYYKVRACRKADSKTYYGDYSSVLKVTTKKK